MRIMDNANSYVHLLGIIGLGIFWEFENSIMGKKTQHNLPTRNPYLIIPRSLVCVHMIISPLLCGVSSIQGTLLCDAHPPCRIVVHMLTIIQFLRMRANIHTCSF